MWQGKDRRRYYRVDDKVAVRYIRLSDPQSLAGELSELSLKTRLADLELALDQALAKLARTSPEAYEVADLLNRKLQLTLEATGIGLEEGGPASLVTRDINLSVGGLSFHASEAIAPGENLLIDLLFYPERRTVRVLARVVAAEPEESGVLLRLDFERVTDADREILMSHIMRLQSDRLRHRDGVAAQSGSSGDAAS